MQKNYLAQYPNLKNRSTFKRQSKFHLFQKNTLSGRYRKSDHSKSGFASLEKHTHPSLGRIKHLGLLVYPISNSPATLTVSHV